MNKLIPALSILLSSFAVHAADLTYATELKAIAFNESSNGLNMNHVRMTSGMHKGDHAGGQFGMMPNTVREIVSKTPSLSKYSYLLGLTNDQISDTITKNKQVDYDIAYAHWKRLRHRMGPRRAAYAWLNGAFAAAKASQETIENHWYAKKFHDALVRKFIRHEHAKDLQ